MLTYSLICSDITAFEEVFAYACPKFIIPSPPVPLEDSTANFNQEALRLQQKLFLVSSISLPFNWCYVFYLLSSQNEVKQQTLVTTIRSYLKLYSTISTAKLSNFLKADDQGAQDADQIKTYLTSILTYKYIIPFVNWIWLWKEFCCATNTRHVAWLGTVAAHCPASGPLHLMLISMLTRVHLKWSFWWSVINICC